MVFSSIIRTIGRSQLNSELLARLGRDRILYLNGISRLPKGLVASTLAQTENRPLFVVTATTEEASRHAAQLEAMGWQNVYFYPTTEASPYEPFDPETETTWGQLQVLADLILKTENPSNLKIAIVATERALQPHLPPVEAFKPYCIVLNKGMSATAKTLDLQLAQLGYERVPLVETEGQWSRRGDIVDVFPVASELPVRLEWFGDDLDQLREFDPATQRSLDKIPQLILTPTDFAPIILEQLGIAPEEWHQTEEEATPTRQGVRRLLGNAFSQPASILDYLPHNTLIAIDEPAQCAAHSQTWVQHAEESFHQSQSAFGQKPIKALHRPFAEALSEIDKRFAASVHLSELAEETIKDSPHRPVNLASRPIPILPHQFAKLAETLREQIQNRYSTFLISAQPSRSVALLQEHDCPAKFVPNPHDYPAIDKLQVQHTPTALKYSGLAELEGFILPTFRLVVVSDREFYGQHSLATPSYVRKRRRAASKQVDPNKLQPGDYVVHRNHGVGKFIKLESLTMNNETREYLAIQYADGILRVAADQFGVLSRFRTASDQKPELHKLSSKVWEKTKNKVRKTVKKLAVDLLQLYAQRSQQTGFSYPQDSSWQEELEESFPYQPTPDQLKTTQDVKRDMESQRPMDRLVCGDVGFGKTEVAIRAILKR
uniref:CarD family transcriptional regulator n=1 Tax=Desertifilum tharense IPPAS B-1220 TaxID=1781255 RepID=A0ACD5GSQ4_9CYAN